MIKHKIIQKNDISVLIKISKMLLRTSHAQLDNVDMQVCVSGPTFFLQQLD